MAAFDDAIADGVDIISVSLAGETAFDYDRDSLSIGSFHGLKEGVLTVMAAGNFGPAAGSIASVAPWLFSVAASNTDRRIVDKVVLGNGQTLVVCFVDPEIRSLIFHPFPFLITKSLIMYCLVVTCM